MTNDQFPNRGRSGFVSCFLHLASCLLYPPCCLLNGSKDQVRCQQESTVEGGLRVAGEKPQATEGKDFYDTGVALVTDEPVDGVESISVAEGLELCWG